jgi:hypothetical protein
VDALNPHPLPPSKIGALKLESLLPIPICCNEDKRIETRRDRLGIAWNESGDLAVKYREKPMAQAPGTQPDSNFLNVLNFRVPQLFAHTQPFNPLFHRWQIFSANV